MKISIINGVIVPAITFFDKEFNINIELSLLLLHHIRLNGASAIFLFGTTGEGISFLNKIENKIPLIELAQNILKDQIPILVGIFGNNAEEVLNELEELGKKFVNIGFVISPPIQETIKKEELNPYFENILGSTALTNPIYLYNNPALFKETEIDPNIINKLIDFPNLKGIKDSSKKINKYIEYLNFLSEDFCIYCGKEGMFSTFLQLIPPELRKFCGVVPSFSNISNICEKLYQAALKENTLEAIRLQEVLEEYRNKIYDIRLKIGKQPRGLKTAFYSLYKESVSVDFNEAVYVSPELQRPFEDFTYDRIKATVRYLTNQGYIDRFYPIQDELYIFDDIKKGFSHLLHLGEIVRIKGPYGGKINAVYRLKFEHDDLVFRTRISEAFRYEDLAKEKLLYPFLDNTLDIKTPDLREKIKEIVLSKTGSYIFNPQKPPLVNVGDLVYFDETKQNFPYIYTLHKYIHGKPLYYVLNRFRAENKNLNATHILNFFKTLGEVLGKLHTIKFDGFYEKVSDIGKDLKISFADRFKKELEFELLEAKKNKFKYNKEVQDYINDNISLIEEEYEPVLYHNDFQGQNIIVREEKGTLQFKGLIDFDNWQIGVRPMDFVKILYWDINPLHNDNIKQEFFNGYVENARVSINRPFKQKIEIFSLLWFLRVYNFELDKIQKGEQKASVDQRFPLPEVYLGEIKKILGI